MMGEEEGDGGNDRDPHRAQLSSSKALPRLGQAVGPRSWSPTTGFADTGLPTSPPPVLTARPHEQQLLRLRDAVQRPPCCGTGGGAAICGCPSEGGRPLWIQQTLLSACWEQESPCESAPLTQSHREAAEADKVHAGNAVR